MTETATRRHHSWLRTGVMAAASLPLLGGAWLAVCIHYVGFPRIDPIQIVDALHVLGPSEGSMDAAQVAMAESGAATMVITVSPQEMDGWARDYCASQPFEVLCVMPEPFTTRGESMTLGRIAAERGWEKVAVLTNRSHVSRARMQMNRCVDADVVLWKNHEELSTPEWLRRFVYHSGAWVKAQFVRGC